MLKITGGDEDVDGHEDMMSMLVLAKLGVDPAGGRRFMPDHVRQRRTSAHSPEGLDTIISYDIKYHMGKGITDVE